VEEKEKPENCIECDELVDVTTYMGYCRRHKVPISLPLGTKMRVCDDWENEKVWLTAKAT
jgi:hypothetical protein